MFNHNDNLRKLGVVCFGFNKKAHNISRCQNHKNSADGVATRIQHGQRNRRTLPKQAGKLILQDVCQRLPESENDESEYEDSDDLIKAKRNSN